MLSAMLVGALLPVQALRAPLARGSARGLLARGSAHSVLALRAARSVNMAAPSAMPTSETGVDELLESYPTADGRGTLVAVLDTGCDLAAAGLQTTSDGRPKYVDFLDCTGGGDVDTTKTAARAADGTVEGLSGRALQLGEWAEGIAEFRVGAVRLFSLLPTSVSARITRERKATFEASQHESVARVQRELDALEAGELSGAAKAAAKTDLELMLKELDAMSKAYHDAGPLLDVLVFEARARVPRS